MCPRVAVGVGVGVPFGRKRRTSIFALALALVTDIKLFGLAMTGQIKAAGNNVIGLISNFRI